MAGRLPGRWPAADSKSGPSVQAIDRREDTLWGSASERKDLRMDLRKDLRRGGVTNPKQHSKIVRCHFLRSGLSHFKYKPKPE